MKELHTLKGNIPEEIYLAAAAMLYGWSSRGEFRWDGTNFYRREVGYNAWRVVTPSSVAEWRNAYRRQAPQYLERAKERFVQ